MAKPFLKWAGGKGQLLDVIEENLPRELIKGEMDRYIEPFVGGGAVFFFLQKHFTFSEAVILDINPDLILTYKVVKKDVEKLVGLLYQLQEEYLPLEDEERKKYYYALRDEFNASKGIISFNKYSSGWVKRAAQLIFLNRTCFNGLYRVNSKGEFNVPMGSYKNPKICDEENLKAVSEVLSEVEIVHGDFREAASRVKDNCFIYFDPPYRPISATSSFNSYSKKDFDDQDQLRLAEFFRELDSRGAKLMLSNSDPKNEDPKDDFFDDAYSEFEIKRIPAKRLINSNADGRGTLNELLIMNYS